MSDKRCPCCAEGVKEVRQFRVPVDGEIMALSELPVGDSGTVVEIKPDLRGRKKFADVGLVLGSTLNMEAHAPFGGLLRVRVMGSSMAIHRDDAASIMVRKGEEKK